jgi:hypothetical protein
MYKTANLLPEKIRSKSVAALLAGLVALTALSMTPLTASAGTTGVSAEQVKTIVIKYLKAHPDQRNSVASSIVAGTPHGVYVGDSEHQEP